MHGKKRSAPFLRRGRFIAAISSLFAIAIPLVYAATTITVVDNSAALVGYYSSMAIGSDGFPVVSYQDATNGDLRIAKCGNASCSSGNTLTTVDSTSNVGLYTSIAIGNDGYPVVSYNDFTNGYLKVVKCGNAACSSGNTITTIDSGTSIGLYTSIAIGSDGYPVISYSDSNNADLKVAKCGNAACSSGNTLTTIDSTGNVGRWTSIAVASDGYPVISYLDFTNADLKIAKCGNAACSSGNTLTTVDSSGQVGQYTSLALGSDGYPVVSYHYVTSDDLKVLKCGNAACSSGNTRTTLDSTGTVGLYTSIAVGGDGLPIVSYLDNTSGTKLKIIKCANSSCTSSSSGTTVDSSIGTTQFTSVKCGNDNYPVISYLDSSTLNVAYVAESAFLCADTTAPTVSTLSPTDNALGVSTTANLVITFGETTRAGTGSLTIKKTSDDSTVETITVSGALLSGNGTTQLTLNPSTTLSEQTSYYVVWGANAFKDTSGNHVPAQSSSTYWNFTIGDFTAPAVSSLSPTDNATGVSATANLVITFDEAVQGGTGSILVKKSSDDSTVETISASGALVTGSGTTTITINPSTALSDGTEYYVTIGANAFRDGSRNHYAGISTSTTWSFTTAAAAASSSSSSASSSSSEASQGGGGHRGSRKASDSARLSRSRSASEVSSSSSDASANDIRARVCVRMERLRSISPSTFMRANRRLSKRYGFACGR